MDFLLRFHSVENIENDESSWASFRSLFIMKMYAFLSIIFWLFHVDW